MIRSLSAGAIIGLVQIILATSFAALIFTGPLSAFVAEGIGLTLMAAIISGAVVAVLSSLPGTISGNQDVPAAILAVMTPAIVASMPAEAGATETFVTVVATIGLTTVLTGVAFYGLGRFGLGGLVRFLPYPVIGGFLAGTGWLLAKGAVGIMADVTPSLSTLGQLTEPEVLFRWLPGVLLAVVFLVVLKRSDHFLTFPGMIVAATVLFFLFAGIHGISVNELSAGGWLLGPFPEGNLWQPPSAAELTLVQWQTIGAQAVNIASIILLSTVSLLLNTSGLELATGRDVNLDRELQVAGLGNLAAGLTGGIVSYHQLTTSAMNDRLGASSRLGGLFAAALCGLVLLFGTAILSLFPKLLLGAVLFFFGLSFLVEWLIDAWFSLPRADAFVVSLILVIMAVVGFLEAIGAGLLVAIGLFVIKYSRVDVVRDELSGTSFESRVTRRPVERRVLRKRGEERYILRLQGFIFFGTADRLLEKIERRIQDPDLPAPRYLLLDFRRVTGIDSTALLAFEKIRRLAEANHLILVLTELSPNIHRQLVSLLADEDAVRLFPDLDRGLEWCESRLLKEAGVPPGPAQNALRQELTRIVNDAEEVETLLAYFEPWQLEAGQYLMRQGDSPHDLYLIASGQVTARLEPEDGKPMRLQTVQSGQAIGEIGFFLGHERTAAVITDEPSVVYRLSVSAWEEMRRKDPRIASALYKVIVHLLGERVIHLVNAVDALRR